VKTEEQKLLDEIQQWLEETHILFGDAGAEQIVEKINKLRSEIGWKESVLSP
jgi:hypothetical protein